MNRRLAYTIGLTALCLLAGIPRGSVLALDESAATTEKAPVVLDGRTLFEVGASGSWTAQQRADEINCLLRDTVTDGDPIAVDLVQRDGTPTIRLGAWHLLTVMDGDLTPGIDPDEQAQHWVKSVETATLQARLERTTPYLVGAALRTLAALALAALLQWSLWQMRRRLTPWLRAANPGAPGKPNWQVAIELLSVGVQTLAWVMALWFSVDQFPAAREVGFDVLRVISQSFRASLFTVDERHYSADDLLWLVAAVGLLWLAVGILTRMLSSRLMHATGATNGALQPATTVVRYGLMFVGLVVILQLGGINLSSLAILASVLGVGIGFGLQGVANNFVSGIIISFERPIRPGDFVALGDLEGTVLRVGGRSTVIRTLDRVSIIVPNSRLLEGEVVNWSHDDDLARLHVPVGVAYGSDVARVRQALLDAASSHPAVLGDPRPEVRLHGFGDNALDFELLVWSKDPPGQPRLKSDLNFGIEANLRRAGIEIPFPQRTLHLPAGEVAAVVERLREVQTPAAVELYDSNGAPTVVHRQNGTPLQHVHERASIPTVAVPARHELDLATLTACMRGPGGVEIKDRRHHLSLYPRCFVGSEAVVWLVQTLDLTRDEAVRLGQRLVEAAVAHHVLDEHPFRDGHYFYRFYADEG